MHDRRHALGQPSHLGVDVADRIGRNSQRRVGILPYQAAGSVVVRAALLGAGARFDLAVDLLLNLFFSHV